MSDLSTFARLRTRRTPWWQRIRLPHVDTLDLAVIALALAGAITLARAVLLTLLALPTLTAGIPGCC